jgi:hypothetical protein
VITLAASLVGSAHLLFEGIARYAESRDDVYLWKQEDYLRLLSPAYHAGRGAGRLFLYGPSEVREGLLPEEMAVQGLTAYQGAQSMGTLEDGVLVFDYLERAYGSGAFPDVIVLGITPRFIANIRAGTNPLIDGIRKYSPHFNVDEGVDPPALVPKDLAQSLKARLAWYSVQPDRYRRGLTAVAVPFLRGLMPTGGLERRMLRPSKYLVGKIASEEQIRLHLEEEPGDFWGAVRAWDPPTERDRITRELRQLLDDIVRHKSELYVVAMPELSIARDLFDDRKYQDYLAIVRLALGDTPFLNLRTYLTDDEFFDDAHATWAGGIRLSARVSAFVEHERQRRRSAEDVE